MSKPPVYHIPYKFRRVENLHILLWLIKDACWALNLKYPALIMIIPTLLVAILITWQTRKITGEFLHNLAIDFWITANCTWMIRRIFWLGCQPHRTLWVEGILACTLWHWFTDPGILLPHLHAQAWYGRTGQGTN